MAEPVSRSRLFIPGLGGLYDGLGDKAYPLVRFTCGALLVPHGWAKIVDGGVATYNEAGVLVGGTAGAMANMGFPAPEILAWYIGLLELVGGALIAVGLFTRFFALLVVGFMFVAAFVVHVDAWFWTNRGMEMPLLWMAVAIAVFIRGGGNWSVDRAMSKEF